MRGPWTKVYPAAPQPAPEWVGLVARSAREAWGTGVASAHAGLQWPSAYSMGWGNPEEKPSLTHGSKGTAWAVSFFKEVG